MWGIVACQTPPKIATQKISVHGHRGSRGTHPENTMPAFQEAVSSTADVLELDLHLSKDNVLIISHDFQITDRTCRDKAGKPLVAPIRIRDLTVKELKQFDCGSATHPGFPEQKQIPGTSLVTLEELLRWIVKTAPTVELNIETKMDEEDRKKNPDSAFFVQKIVDLLRKYDYTERSILQSFDFRTLEAAKPIAPKLRRSALFADQKDFCHRAVQFHPQFASPEQSLLTAAEVEFCHQNGIQVVPWTLDYEDEWTQAIDMGVDAIITNYPRKLVAYLSERAKHGHP